MFNLRIGIESSPCLYRNDISNSRATSKFCRNGQILNSLQSSCLPYNLCSSPSMAVDVLGEVAPVGKFCGSNLDPLAKVFTPKHTFSRSIMNSNGNRGKISSKSHLNPSAKACYPNIVSFTASVLNPMAKPYKTPHFDDSSHSPKILPFQPRSINLSSLNPSALPFVSSLVKEIDSHICKSNICCELHLMDMTPIPNSVSTADLSFCSEDFSDDLTCTLNSSCESIIFNDSAGVFTSEAKGALNPCTESFVSDDILISNNRIDSLLNPHNAHNVPFRTANPNIDPPVEVLPPISIAQIDNNDDPKSLLKELKTKNRERPVIAHLNINFLDPKFEPLVDMIKDNVDILLVSETKLDDSYPEGRFYIEGYKDPIRLDRNKNGGTSSTSRN